MEQDTKSSPRTKYNKAHHEEFVTPELTQQAFQSALSKGAGTSFESSDIYDYGITNLSASYGAVGGYKVAKPEDVKEMGMWESVQSGFNTSIIATELKKLYTNKGEYFAPSVRLNESQIEHIMEEVGYNPTQFRAVITGLTSAEDIDNHIRIIKENQIENAKMSKQGLFNNFLAGIGSSFGNPIDIAVNFATFGSSWGARALYTGATSAISGQYFEKYTGIESDIIMDALGGAALSAGFDMAFHRSAFTKTTKLTQAIADAIDKNAGIDPNRVMGKSKVAARLNQFREGLESAMPKFFISGVLDDLKSAEARQLRDKILKSQKGLRRIDPVTNKSEEVFQVYGSEEATVEEIVTQLAGEARQFRDIAENGVSELSSMGLDGQAINRAINEYLSTGNITNIQDANALAKATEVGKTLKDFYNSRGQMFKDLGLLDDLYQGYSPLIIDNEKRLNFMGKFASQAEAEDYITSKLLEGSNDAKTHQRLRDFWEKGERKRIDRENAKIESDNKKRTKEFSFHSKSLKRGEEYHAKLLDDYSATVDGMIDDLETTNVDNVIDVASQGYDILDALEDKVTQQSSKASQDITDKYSREEAKLNKAITKVDEDLKKANEKAEKKFSRTEDEWADEFNKKDKRLKKLKDDLTTWQGLYEFPSLQKARQGYEGAINDPNAKPSAIKKARKAYARALTQASLSLQNGIQKLKARGATKDVKIAQRKYDDFVEATTNETKTLQEIEQVRLENLDKAKEAVANQAEDLKKAKEMNELQAKHARADAQAKLDEFKKKNTPETIKAEIKKAEDHYQNILKDIQKKRDRLDNKVGSVANKVTNKVTREQLRAIRKDKSRRRRNQKIEDSLWRRLERHYKPQELIDADAVLTDQAFDEWRTQQAHKTAKGWLDQGQTTRTSFDHPTEGSDYREARVPWNTSYESKDGFRCDDLRVDAMEAFDRYSRHSGGDIAMKRVFNKDSFEDSLKMFVESTNAERQANEKLRTSSSEQENLDKALRQLHSRIYGTSSREADKNLQWLNAVGEVLRNLTFMTSNAYMGILNHTETSMMLQAQGAKAMLTQIPGVRKFLGKVGNGNFTPEDMRMVHDMLFIKELSTQNIFGDVRARNRRRYKNKFVADIVAGSEWLSNALPTTKYLQHSQISIVECAQDAMLSELIHRHYNKTPDSKWLKEQDVILKRLNISKAKFSNLNKALDESFMISKDGTIVVKDINKLKNNTDAMLTLRRLGDYVADESILRPSMGDNFLFADSQHEFLNLLMQFKTFALRSYNNRLVKSMNRWEEGHGQTEMLNHLISLSLATVGNIGIAYFRTAGMEEEERKKYLERTLGFSDLTDIGNHLDDVLLLGLNRSSIYAAPALLANSLGFGTSAKTTADEATAYDSEGKELTSRFTAKTLTDMLPSARKGIAVGDLIFGGVSDYLSTKVEEDEYTDRQRYLAANRVYRDLKTILPNWGYITNFLYENTKPNKEDYY